MNKQVSPAVMIGIIVAVVIVVCLVGWQMFFAAPGKPRVDAKVAGSSREENPKNFEAPPANP